MIPKTINQDCQQMPFFSIITVTYNDCGGLKKTANSICCQSYSDYEWIIIDGESHDETMHFLTSLTQLNTRWISEKDQGIYDAMNKGILLCTGKYIVFMNAGDLFADALVLENVYQAVCAAEYLPDLIFGGAKLIFANGSSVTRPARNLNKYIWNGLPAIHQATYFKANLLKANLYDLKYNICGDYYIISTLYNLNVSAIYLGSPLVDFRVGDTSYHNPLNVLVEGYKIQRDVLKSSILLRLFSLLRRLTATILLYTASILSTFFKFKH